MTPFEDYKMQSNLAHRVYGKPVAAFDIWLVAHMPKTEREVAAVRKAWEAACSWENIWQSGRIDALERENEALRRLRDDLHETTNRYLERARKAEAETAFTKRRIKLLVNGSHGGFAQFDASKLTEGQNWFDGSSLYLQQFGRALRPGYKRPSLWMRLKRSFKSVWAWLGEFPL